jgi:hypothetical protein
VGYRGESNPYAGGPAGGTGLSTAISTNELGSDPFLVFVYKLVQIANIKAIAAVDAYGRQPSRV